MSGRVGSVTSLQRDRGPRTLGRAGCRPPGARWHLSLRSIRGGAGHMAAGAAPPPSSEVAAPLVLGSREGVPAVELTMRSRSRCVMRKAGGGRATSPWVAGLALVRTEGAPRGCGHPPRGREGRQSARGSGCPGGTSARGGQLPAHLGQGRAATGPSWTQGERGHGPVGLGGRAPCGGAGTGHPGMGLS